MWILLHGHIHQIFVVVCVVVKTNKRAEYVQLIGAKLSSKWNKPYSVVVFLGESSTTICFKFLQLVWELVAQQKNIEKCYKHETKHVQKNDRINSNSHIWRNILLLINKRMETSSLIINISTQLEPIPYMPTPTLTKLRWKPNDKE